MTLEHLLHDYLRDDAGTPLGPGMPSGAPLRADGESHYDAWLALVRRDPCAYCGAAGAAATVDHVDPRSRPARGLGTAHGWINTVGACARCNGAKRDLGLLVFLHRRRRGSRRRRRPRRGVTMSQRDRHRQQPRARPRASQPRRGGGPDRDEMGVC